MTLIDLQGHFSYCKRFHCLHRQNATYVAYEVGRHMSAFIAILSYSTRRSVMWCWARPVSDS